MKSFTKMTFIQLCILLFTANVSSFTTVSQYHVKSTKKQLISTHFRHPYHPLIIENTKTKIIHKSIKLHATQSLSFDDSNESNPIVKKEDSYTNINVEALVFMSLLAIQFGIQPVLVRAFVPPTICKSSYVLVQECLKFVFSLFGFYLSGKEVVSKSLEGWKPSTAFKVAGIPAFLYLIQNLASLLAYQNLQPLTYNVLNQTKTLSAALCCYLIIGRKQSKPQIFALFLLLSSALIIEKIISFSWLTSLGTTGFQFQSFHLLTGSSRHWTHGVAPILLASFLSGLAGSLTQKNLQSKSGCGKSGGRNPFLFGMELNFFSLVLLLGSLFVTQDGKIIASNGLFHNWTSKTIIPVITNALGGIIVGLVTKYAGSVKKGFALIFGILISGIIQAMTGGNGVQIEQIVGGFIAALSLLIHNAYPYKS